MGKVILIGSGKGGVGKTTITANLGLLLAKDGYRVVLIDGDMGLNNLDVALNVEDNVIYDILDVIEGRVKLEQALINVDKEGRLRLLPSSKINVSDKIKPTSFYKIVQEVSMTADFVFIDAPAGIEQGFHRAAYCAHEAIMVTTPHLSAIRDVDRAISVLSTYKLSNIGIVVNRVRNDLLRKGEIIDPESISKLLRYPLYATIPESDRIGIYSIINYSRRDAVNYSYQDLKNMILNDKTEPRKRESFFRRVFK